MTRPTQKSQLDAALRALGNISVIPGIASAVDEQADAVLADLRETIVAEIPAFVESGNPDVLPELDRHTAEHAHEICRLCRGSMVGDFEFVRGYARHRAEHKFPLEAILHAYRCGHKIIASWLRKAALAMADESSDTEQIITSVSDFAIEYTDTISTIATFEYVNQTRRLAEAEGDSRTELLAVLLSGYDESDGRVAKLLRRSGFLDQRQSFCVAVAQSVDPTEMENPARVRRLAESLGDTLRPLPIKTLVGLREDKVVAVFSAVRRMAGWTAPQTALAERVRPQLLKVGNAVLIGMSTDAPSTSHIPKAYREATLALDFADLEHRVVQYSDLPVRRLLVHLVGDTIWPALPPWADDFFAADAKARGSFTATLRAYADADMNLLQAAKALGVHPNTIYARMQKIADVTGMNALTYHALTELLLAADCRSQGITPP